MNLKESFRYQNYLTGLFDTMLCYLRNKENFVRVRQEHFRKSANPDAQDETIDATTERPYIYDNKTIIDFMNAVMDEKHGLAIAIDKAKTSCGFDIDAETMYNTLRRSMASALEHVCAIKPSESKTQGSDFKFNATGDQVRYLYDVKVITTIDFDRNNVKHLAKEITKAADDTSSAIDHCVIDVDVAFDPMFNVADSVEDALEAYVNLAKYVKGAV